MINSNTIFLEKEVSLFRTSVNSKHKVKLLKPLLNKLLGAKNWSFDLEDSNTTLQVYYFSVMNNFLAKEINKLGFECIEITNQPPT